MAENKPTGLPREVFAIGGSAGSIKAMRLVLQGLPRDFRAAILLVIHRGATLPSLLAQGLGGQASVEVLEPGDGAQVRGGRVYLAPPDYHMTVGDGAIHLDRGPKQHHTRPAI